MQDIKREKTENHNEHTLVIEGRNAVLEAFRSGRTIDKLLYWTAVRTDLSGRSCVRQKSMEPY